MRRMLPIALLAACSVLGLCTEVAESQSPKFAVVTLDGEAYGQDSLKGRPALLIFWAPWCRVCQKELPVLSEFYAKERPAPLRVLSIGFADIRTHVEEFVKSRPSIFVFPIAYDIDNDVARAFKVTATPTLVLLDDKGAVVMVHRGAGVLHNLRFRSLLSTMGG